MNDFEGKVVLVTGAAAGIGRATALAFARERATLVVSDIDTERLAALRSEVEAQGVRCLAEVVDVASEDAMRTFADRVHAAVGAPHILVNNAGIGYLGSFVGSPLLSWRRVLDINVMGVVHGCHFFLPGMIAAGGPRRIVNVASLAGIAPAPNMAAYAASKHAVMGLTDVLSMELDGTEVGTTAVCPGIINTEITSHRRNVSASISDEQLGKLRSYYAAHGATADAVAAAIVDGVRRRKPIVLVGPYARPMYHLKRISRAFVRRTTIADARKNGYL
jgi:NAD(P)-dependent dehydrogenase (short-subunit alcohol dehydrogenase family)